MENTTAACGSSGSRGRGRCRGRGRGLSPRALNNSKGSPERLVCPLAPNTPAVPPLPKRQSWHTTSEDPNNLNDPLGDFASSNDNQAAEPVTEILQPSADFICSPSTAMCLADEDIKFNVVPNLEMEFVDFKPTSIVQKSEASSEMGPSKSQDFTFDDIERNNSDPESEIDEIDEIIAESDIVDITCRRDVWCQMLDDETLAMLGQNDASDDSALRDLARSSVEDVLHFDWSGDPDVFKGQRETFTGQSGPTFDKEE